MIGIVNVKLLSPISYVELIGLLNASSLILSDSGGIQEEACILGKNIIILRNETERPEIIETGQGILVGADQSKILSYFDKFIDLADKKIMKKNIYGKPGVSKKILSEIKKYFRVI